MGSVGEDRESGGAGQAEDNPVRVQGSYFFASFFLFT